MTIDDQIKFCQDKRGEWERTTGEGEVAMIASAQIKAYAEIEETLKLCQLLKTSVDKMHVDIHGEPVKQTKSARTPEERISKTKQV